MTPLSALDCVLAARRSELRDLRALERMVGLVGAVAGFVHQLQGERGLSSLVVAGRLEEAAQRLQAQRRSADAAQSELQERLGDVDLEQASSGGHGARLYARLGVALQTQQALRALRAQVDAQGYSVEQLVQAYSRLVEAWLSFVFEVADVAGNAEVSRQLIALFNLTQTKELVGQERALGSALFASGHVDGEGRQRTQDLIDSQLRGLAAFGHFASERLQLRMAELQRHSRTDERARLRRLLLQPSEHGALHSALGSAWFDACTAHMERLKRLEQAVLQELGALCSHRCRELQREVSELQALCASPQPVSSEQALMSLAMTPSERASHTAVGQAPAVAALPAGADRVPEWARQVMDLVQQQARRLQEVTAELEEARATLQERKLVERAKGVLMAQAGLSEEEAYQALRRRAMQHGQRLAEVAQALLHRTN